MTSSVRPRVSIVIVPRQQFGIIEDCVAALYRHTPEPFELVVVHFGDELPATITSRPNLKVVAGDGFLYPHESKNLGLQHCSDDSEWLVFMDNDVKVHAGWLDTMLTAAVEEQARIVHPLYLFERGERRVIHMAHGEFSDNGQPGGSRPVMKLVNRKPEQADGLVRRDSDFVEFHLWMVHRDVMQRLGGFDPITIGEHIHYSLRLRELGERIVFEPQSVVTYCADVDGSEENRDYLRYRWGPRAARDSISRLRTQWPEFDQHWRSKSRAAWEFRSANEPWYPPVGKMIGTAVAIKHKVVGKR